MKSFKALLILVSLFFANTLYAATDYNSSRSNRSTTNVVESETTTLIQKVSADALTVSKSMIAVDLRDGFEGEYLVTVEVRVSLQRCIKVEDEPETVCTDVR
ncbi:MAG: hypothetical protein ACI88A_000736 [Paraglaciecola sp.]|jgi:hypothetical protein